MSKEQTLVAITHFGLFQFRLEASRLVRSPPMKQFTYSSDYGHLLAELRSARIQAGVSQVQLAETLGQLQTFVSKCELGDRRLDVIELRTWVIALGGDPVAFMAGLEDRINRNAAPPVHVKQARKRSTGT